MLINQLKNIYLKYYSTLMYHKRADQFDELFLFLESFKHVSLMIRYGYKMYFFVWMISSYCFMIAAASSGFSTFSSFPFNSSDSIISLMVMESISCFLIYSLLCLLVFFVFSEILCCCKKITAIPEFKNILYKQKMLCVT